MAIDPVCETPIQPHQAEGMIWYRGLPFYFCSAECREAFDRRPAKYFALRPLGR